jgi:hypothetical protein
MTKCLSIKLLVAGILVTGTVAVAQQGQTPTLYVAYVDYDVFHNQFIDRCASRIPETAQSFQAAIAQWSKNNRTALQDVRSILRDNTVREGMLEKDADARYAQLAANVTQFMIKGLEAMPGSQLKAACSGAYAEHLGSPGMDFVVFREKLKAELKR